MESAGLVVLIIPFVFNLILANFADHYRGREEAGTVFSAIAYVLLSAIYVLLIVVGALFLVLGSFIPVTEAMLDSLAMLDPPPGLPAFELLSPIGIGLAAPSLVGLLLLLRPVRGLFARFTAIDRLSTVHAVALSYMMLIVVNLALTLAVGLDNLANLVEESGAQGGSGEMGLIGLWVQAILFVVLAFAGVGLFIRRGPRAALERLGLVRPSWRQVVFGIVVIGPLLLAVAAIAAVGEATGFGPDRDVERLMESLLGDITSSWLGILTIGLSAGIGEEILFRGALQPKFGLILTSVLFTVLHSQYGLTLSTAVVFLLAIVLGIIRQRTNTTTAIITHAGYNSLLSVVALFLPDAF